MLPRNSTSFSTFIVTLSTWRLGQMERWFYKFTQMRDGASCFSLTIWTFVFPGSFLLACELVHWPISSLIFSWISGFPLGFLLWVYLLTAVIAWVNLLFCILLQSHGYYKPLEQSPISGTSSEPQTRLTC